MTEPFLKVYALSEFFKLNKNPISKFRKNSDFFGFTRRISKFVLERSIEITGIRAKLCRNKVRHSGDFILDFQPEIRRFG
jgi:hypothetical protein